MGSPILSVNIFANSAKTISTPPAPPGQTAPLLPLLSSLVKLVFVGINTSVKVKARRKDFCLGPSSRLFFERILVTPGFSWMQLGAKSNGTLSISKKRFKTWLLTLNTSCLSSKDSMRKELKKNPTLSGFFAKVSNRR